MLVPLTQADIEGTAAEGSAPYKTDIDVLRALERGEIDVTTASRLLAEKPDA